MPITDTRRSWTKSAILLLGLAVLSVLSTAAFAFLTSPLREPPPPDWFAVSRLSALPDDGRPLRVAVTVSRRDAWTRQPDETLGYVFLRRKPETSEVVGLRAEHHSLFRIAVEYDDSARLFRSRCWKVAFDLEGREVEDGGRPPIGDEMEQLSVRLVGDEVWVHYPPPERGGSQ